MKMLHALLALTTGAIVAAASPNGKTLSRLGAKSKPARRSSSAESLTRAQEQAHAKHMAASKARVDEYQASFDKDTAKIEAQEARQIARAAAARARKAAEAKAKAPK